MNETRALARFAAQTRFTDLPRGLVDSCKITWAEACEKFRRYTASVLGPPRATALIDAVGGLEHVADMAGVVRLVAAT